MCRHRAAPGCGGARSGGIRRRRADLFDEIVDRFGGSVGGPGAVPVDDGDLPGGQGAAWAAELWRIVGEFGGVALGELRAGDVMCPESRKSCSGLGWI